MKSANTILERKQREQAAEHADAIREEILDKLERNDGAFCFDTQSWRIGIITMKQRAIWCKDAAARGEIEFIKKDGRWWVARKEG